MKLTKSKNTPKTVGYSSSYLILNQLDHAYANQPHKHHKLTVGLN